MAWVAVRRVETEGQVGHEPFTQFSYWHSRRLRDLTRDERVSFYEDECQDLWKLWSPWLLTSALTEYQMIIIIIIEQAMNKNIKAHAFLYIYIYFLYDKYFEWWYDCDIFDDVLMRVGWYLKSDLRLFYVVNSPASLCPSVSFPSFIYSPSKVRQ